MGKKLVRSIDSIFANLVEGDGRRSDSNSSRFFRYARSSARETRHWIITAARKGRIDLDQAPLPVEVDTMIARMISGLLRHSIYSEGGRESVSI